jgi:hypothetical protein
MRTEADLRVALASLEAGAPTVDEVLNPAPVRSADSRTSRRPTRWLLPVAASLLVIALAATALGLATRDRPSGEKSAARSPAIATLINIDWSLVQFRVGSTWTSIDPNFVLVIRHNGALQEDVNTCNSWIGTMHLGAGTATIAAHLWDHSCPAPGTAPTKADGRSVPAVEHVLTGRVTWVIKGHYLTIIKAGVGELIYRRAGVDPPSPSDS